MESLIPIRDASTDIVSQSRAVHKPIEEPQAQVQPAEQEAVGSVNSSEAETDQREIRSQEPQGKSQTPPPPPSARSQKRQCTIDQPPKGSGDAPPKTPPPRASGGIVIREPTSDARPTAQVGSNVLSSFRPKVGWQTIFRLGNEPLPVTVNVRTWAQGKDGQISRNLAQGLLLPEDVHFFLGNIDRSLAARL